jgi:hypothetical protein
MKIKFLGLLMAHVFFAIPLMGQPAARPDRAVTNSTGNYDTDIGVVHDAQQEALEQARQMLAQGEGVRDHDALADAIKEMERAQAALDDARKTPEKLAPAIAAEQAAYQALLKIAPREYRMRQSRNGGQGGGAGQPGGREINELDPQHEDNRYETESQAAAPQNARQREQSQTADRLKELAQRQQDLNGRLRELQTALEAAHTDEERADIQRQLKRLQDEQRQMLANVDEMRQQLAQSPNADSQADTQRQLEQTRSDMERAAQEMDRQSASAALAAGTRAQETMQNLRDDLRKQTSSQFSEQMRQLRNQARDLTRQQDDIGRGLDSLNNGDHQALDNSAERSQIVQQMEQQHGALTNLLSEMRTITEQAEATEPLLSKQLYDTLRHADQSHTEDLLQMGAQLTDRGFLPQAGQVELSTRTNIAALASGIERAADSVLGSESDALRYAQKELDDLTRQVEREIAGAGTNAATEQSNPMAVGQGNRAGNEGTNVAADSRGQARPGGDQAPQNHSPARPPGASEGQSQNGNQGEPADANNGQPAASENQTDGQAQAGGENNPGDNNPSANRNGGDRLRQLAVQLGTDHGDGGPITGNNYVNWADRMRDVEQAVDPEDLRNQLATVRERVSTLRANYRQYQRRPDADIVRQQILAPMTQVRAWLQEEQARKDKSDSLVPLDRDPVPDNYSELVREYYEKLGSAQ